MQELGAAAMEKSGYTKNAYPSQANTELIERVVNEVMKGVEDIMETTKEESNGN